MNLSFLFKIANYYLSWFFVYSTFIEPHLGFLTEN